MTSRSTQPGDSRPRRSERAHPPPVRGALRLRGSRTPSAPRLVEEAEARSQARGAPPGVPGADVQGDEPEVEPTTFYAAPGALDGAPLERPTSDAKRAAAGYPYRKAPAAPVESPTKPSPWCRASGPRDAYADRPRRADAGREGRAPIRHEFVARRRTRMGWTSRAPSTALSARRAVSRSRRVSVGATAATSLPRCSSKHSARSPERASDHPAGRGPEETGHGSTVGEVCQRCGSVQYGHGAPGASPGPGEGCG